MLTSSSAETLHNSGNTSELAVGREIDDSQVTTRLARPADIIEFFGKPQAGTMRAIVALLDGKVVGVIGVVREVGIGKYFCDIHDELQPYLRSITILRAVKQSVEFCEDYKGPLVSIAEHGEGCKMLHRLGFTHLEGALYGWLR